MGKKITATFCPQVNPAEIIGGIPILKMYTNAQMFELLLKINTIMLLVSGFVDLSTLLKQMRMALTQNGVLQGLDHNAWVYEIELLRRGALGYVNRVPEGDVAMIQAIPDDAVATRELINKLQAMRAPWPPAAAV